LFTLHAHTQHQDRQDHSRTNTGHTNRHQVHNPPGDGQTAHDYRGSGGDQVDQTTGSLVSRDDQVGGTPANDESGAMIGMDTVARPELEGMRKESGYTAGT